MIRKFFFNGLLLGLLWVPEKGFSMEEEKKIRQEIPSLTSLCKSAISRRLSLVSNTSHLDKMPTHLVPQTIMHHGSSLYYDPSSNKGRDSSLVLGSVLSPHYLWGLLDETMKINSSENFRSIAEEREKIPRRELFILHQNAQKEEDYHVDLERKLKRSLKDYLNLENLSIYQFGHLVHWFFHLQAQEEEWYPFFERGCSLLDQFVKTQRDRKNHPLSLTLVLKPYRHLEACLPNALSGKNILRESLVECAYLFNFKSFENFKRIFETQKERGIQKKYEKRYRNLERLNEAWNQAFLLAGATFLEYAPVSAVAQRWIEPLDRVIFSSFPPKELLFTDPSFLVLEAALASDNPYRKKLEEGGFKNLLLRPEQTVSFCGVFCDLFFKYALSCSAIQFNTEEKEKFLHLYGLKSNHKKKGKETNGCNMIPYKEMVTGRMEKVKPLKLFCLQEGIDKRWFFLLVDSYKYRYKDHKSNLFDLLLIMIKRLEALEKQEDQKDFSGFLKYVQGVFFETKTGSRSTKKGNIPSLWISRALNEAPSFKERCWAWEKMVSYCKGNPASLLILSRVL